MFTLLRIVKWFLRKKYGCDSIAFYCNNTIVYSIFQPSWLFFFFGLCSCAWHPVHSELTSRRFHVCNGLITNPYFCLGKYVPKFSFLLVHCAFDKHSFLIHWHPPVYSFLWFLRTEIEVDLCNISTPRLLAHYGESWGKVLVFAFFHHVPYVFRFFSIFFFFNLKNWNTGLRL